MASTGPAVLISEARILSRVAALARRISEDYAGVDELVLVGVLRGCYIFLADLSRRLEIRRRIDFIALASYGTAGTVPGAVRLIMDLRTDIAGKHVLVVEDIVDTGHTLQYLLGLLRSRGPASLKTCALLRKPDRLEADVRIDYLGFDIPDAWVVGYGLDCGDRDRALPYIGIIEAGG
ncbi:MAG: hypoxanthine phosphoribosyltransferase [Deltaproteobacteria bacterium]